MSALFVLIAISLLVAMGFLLAFLWATNSGQYEDDYTPSVRMLFDDKPISDDIYRNLSYKKGAGEKLFNKEKSQQNKSNQI
jgi:cbb3-type cytochrome oxidase maturation protein